MNDKMTITVSVKDIEEIQNALKRMDEYVEEMQNKMNEQDELLEDVEQSLSDYIEYNLELEDDIELLEKELEHVKSENRLLKELNNVLLHLYDKGNE